MGQSPWHLDIYSFLTRSCLRHGMVSFRPWRHCQIPILTLHVYAYSVFDHWEQMTYDPLKVRVVASWAAVCVERCMCSCDECCDLADLCSCTHAFVLQDDSPANVIMLDVRKRKGLKPQPNQITGMSQMPCLPVPMQPSTIDCRPCACQRCQCVSADPAATAALQSTRTSCKVVLSAGSGSSLSGEKCLSQPAVHYCKRCSGGAIQTLLLFGISCCARMSGSFV